MVSGSESFSNGVKTARQIYEAYKIMPSLQLHQLRVAAVGKLICENCKQPVDERAVVLACLFHDMGNILKFDFSVLPDSVQPKGIDYWEAIKADYRAKYGDDEHVATERIMQEIGLPGTVRELMKGIGFSKLDRVAAAGTSGQQIIQYSDLRVAPTGILSLEERLKEGRKRYAGSRRSIGASDDDRYQVLVAAARRLEQEVFSRTTIRPEDINDALVSPLVEGLREFPVV